MRDVVESKHIRNSIRELKMVQLLIQCIFNSNKVESVMTDTLRLITHYCQITVYDNYPQNKDKII